MRQKPLRVLLVDDESSLREPLAKYLSQMYGYDVDTAAHAREALDKIKQNSGRYEVALIDDMLIPAPGQEPEPLGVSLTREIKNRYPHLEVIVFTGWGMRSGLECLQVGAYRYLAKPFNREELSMLLQMAAEHSRLKGIAREKRILEQLMETSTALISGRILPEVLDTILQGVKAIGFDRVCLYLLSDDGQTLIGQAQVGMTKAFVGHTRSVASDIQMQTLLRDPRPHIFERTEDEPLPFEQALGREGVHQWACVPLIFQGEVIGKLSMDNKFSQQAITEAELRPVGLFAAQAAAAIENANLVVSEGEQKNHLSRLIASSPNAVIAIDREGNVTNFSEQAERILDYHLHEVVGKSVVPLYGSPQEAYEVSRLLYEAPDGRLINHETSVRNKAGERIPIRLAATQLVDTQGARMGSIGYFEDLRVIRAAEKRLELLLKASNTVAQAENLTDGLQSLAETIVTFLSIGFCRCFLLDEGSQTLQPKAAYPAPVQGNPLDWDPGREEQIVLSEWPLLAEVIAGRQPELLRIDDKRYRSFLAKRSRRLGLKQNIQSVFLVPLKARNNVVGLLTMAELRPWSQAPFSQQKQELAVAIADQVATLIDRIHLLEVTERRRQLLIALDRASRHIRAEKETFKLLWEVVRLAAELVDCTAGGLYINYPQLKELELEVTYELPTQLIGDRLPYTEGLVGLVAQTGQAKVISPYSDWNDRESILEAYHFKTVAAVPLKQAGEVEAVLFVAEATGLKSFTQADLDILERFATHASIALQTSRLMDRDQRKYRLLAILHKASDYIQGARELDKILHVVLTGITAGYGLGFNRAGLLLLDERRETLEGHMGIGHLEEAQARQDWERDQQQDGVLDFGRYLQLLKENSLAPTPINGCIRQLQLPVKSAHPDSFSKVVLEREHVLVTPQDDLDDLPDRFVEAFEPALPLIMVPLLARDQVIGVLVADNKFTRAPITPEDIDLLLTFTNTAAVAINNIQLFHEAKMARERLLSFYEASSALVSSQDPEQVLEDIVEQGRVVAEASGASMFLIDQIGQIRDFVTAGVNKRIDVHRLVRPNGLSMQIMRTDQIEIIGDINQHRDRVNPTAAERGIQATVGLPLSLEGRRIGVMWIDYDRPRTFSDYEIDSMRLYVNQAAIAYDSARRIKELERLHQAAEALAGAAELHEVLEQIVRSARDVLQADSAFTYSYDTVRDRFVLERSVAVGIPVEIWQEFQQTGPRRRGTAYTVMDQGWVGVMDVEDLKQYGFLGGPTSKLLKKIGVRSFQGIALTVGEETLGILYVNYNRPRGFNEDERKIAQTLANLAALALKKAKLLDQVHRANNTARVVAEVTALENLTDTLHSLVQGTQNVLNCDATVLFTYDQDSRTLGYPPIVAGLRYVEQTQLFAQVPPDHFIFTLLGQNEPYIAEDGPSDPTLGNQPFGIREQVESCIAIPLQVGERKVGIMFINYRQSHRFTSDEMTSIELFANQAAVAIRNAQLYEQAQKRAKVLQGLYEQVRQRAEQFQTLYEASRSLTVELSVEAILQKVVSYARQLTGARYGALGVRDEDGSIKPFITSGLNATKKGHLGPPPEGRGVLGLLFQEPKPIRVLDVRKHPDFTGFPPHHPQMTSFLGVPIISKGIFIGSLYMADKLNGLEFSQEDQDVLDLLAAQAAIAIENAHLFEQTRRRARLLDAASQVARGATSILDETQLLDETVQLIVNCFDFCYHAGVFLLDDNREYAVLRAAASEGGQRMLKRGHKLKVGQEGIVGFVTQSGKPRLTTDVGTDSRHFNNPDLPNTRAEMVFPLIARDQVIGALDVQSTDTIHLQDEDITTLQTMADQLANAIHNAQLHIDRARQYEELKRTKGLVGARTAVAWMGMVSAAWRHAIEGHALTIREEITHIRTGLPAPCLNNIERRLTKVETLAQLILEKPITLPLSDEEGVESVPINELLRERLKQLWENEPYNSVRRRLNLKLNNTATVRASPEWLRRLFDLLVDNAVEAMAELSAKALTVSTRLTGAQVEIVFADRGRGIPADLLPKVFHEQVKKSKLEKGLGTGLLMAQTIAHTYGGDIYVGTTGPGGTKMVVTFPIELQKGGEIS